jgi:TPR repeat protein
MSDVPEEIWNLSEAGEYAAALRLALPLATSGNIDAQCFVAEAYQLNLGQLGDGNQALHWYLKAAIAGSPLAYNNLSCIFLAGLPGIESDMELSRYFKTRAKELGFRYD